MSLHGTESTEAPSIIQSLDTQWCEAASSLIVGYIYIFFFGRGQLVQIHRHAHKSFFAISSAVCVTKEWNHDVVFCDDPPTLYLTYLSEKAKTIWQRRAARFLGCQPSQHKVRRDQNIPAKVLLGFYFAACEKEKKSNVCSVVFSNGNSTRIQSGEFCSNCTWIDWWLHP